MPVCKRDWSINRDAVKALVAVYGPREAARQAKLKECTVLRWCARYGWKKASRLIHTNGINGDPSIPMTDDAGDALVKAFQKHKEQSTLNLAHYTAKASKQAAKLSNPLEKARQVRDVATVYKTLWPAEEGGKLIEGEILIGTMKVRDNPEEMLAMTEKLPEIGPPTSKFPPEKAANARELSIQDTEGPQGSEV